MFYADTKPQAQELLYFQLHFVELLDLSGTESSDSLTYHITSKYFIMPEGLGSAVIHFPQTFYS